MLSRRIWQSRALIYAQRLFRLSASGCSSSYHSSVSHSFLLPKPNSRIDFNLKHVKGYCFSAQPVLDIPVGNIVEVPLAQTGEGIAECELLKWYVQEGDYVDDFQPLCEVQSDKATIEITSRYKGKVSNILHGPGDIVKVGATLLKILIDEPACPSMTFDDSENAKSPDSDQTFVNESAFTTVNFDDSENVKNLDSDIGKGKQAGVLSTPAVRSLAKEHGIDINEVCGTGKDGRILKEDVLNFAVKKGISKTPSAVLHADFGELQGAEGISSDAKNKYDRPSEDTILPLR